MNLYVVSMIEMKL